MDRRDRSSRLSNPVSGSDSDSQKRQAESVCQGSSQRRPPDASGLVVTRPPATTASHHPRGYWGGLSHPRHGTDSTSLRGDNIMRRSPLLLIASAALALAGCSAGDDELADSLAAVTQGEEVQDEDAPEESGVPVEVSTDLVDAEGSVVGTAWFRDDDRAMVEVQVAGLTGGFHPMYLYPAGTCDFEGAADGDAALLELPPVLVLENGVGSMTTLAGSMTLDDLLAEAGTALLIAPAVATLGDIPTVSEQVAPLSAGSRVACGAIEG